MKYQLFNWGGVFKWVQGLDGVFWVDPRYLREFKDMAKDLKKLF